jgi:hypothetical protein
MKELRVSPRDPDAAFGIAAITLSAASPRPKVGDVERSRQGGEVQRLFQPWATVAGHVVSSRSVIRGRQANRPLSALRRNRSSPTPLRQ